MGERAPALPTLRREAIVRAEARAQHSAAVLLEARPVDLATKPVEVSNIVELDRARRNSVKLNAARNRQAKKHRRSRRRR